MTAHLVQQLLCSLHCQCLRRQLPTGHIATEAQDACSCTQHKPCPCWCNALLLRVWCCFALCAPSLAAVLHAFACLALMQPASVTALAGPADCAEQLQTAASWHAWPHLQTSSLHG